MKRKSLLKNLKIAIIALLSFYPFAVFASYAPVNGRVSYQAGVLANTNFQETYFNTNDTQTKLGRSQSFAVFVQALGDLNARGSLLGEISIGTHKFCKETTTFVDDYNLEGISFDLGYRGHVAGDFWWSGTLGSLYPWHIRQRINSQPQKYDNSEFMAVYSLNLGLHYEANLFQKPVIYELRIKKYMSGQVDDQAGIGLSIGWRFGGGVPDAMASK